MFRQIVSSTMCLLAAFTQHAAAVDRTRDPGKIAQLNDAATQLDRLAILSDDSDWGFDFTAQKPFYNFAPGGVINMNAATFPAAKGNGMTRKRPGNARRQHRASFH